MKRSLSAVIVLFSLGGFLWGQELYYLEENFESVGTTDRWENSPIIPFKEWKYTYGGQWESNGNPYNPEIPKQGNKNAGMYFPSLNIDSIKLISPYMELAGSGKPTLRFFHCQYERIFKGPDFLRLMFRSSPSAEWDVIESWTSDIPFWVEEIYDIEDIDKKYLTDSFQIAFEGIVGNGYGVYLDSVTVREDTIVQKFVKQTVYNSIKYDAIPAGANSIPLQEIVIRILGNTGEARLDSLTVIPSGSATSYLNANSFKLFYTSGETYTTEINDTSTLIATATLNDGKVVFADIGHDLKLGDNHLWLSASIENTLTGTGSLQFSVPAQGINVSDTLFPSVQRSFGHTHQVYESVFYDDFESGGLSWTLNTGFEVGEPTGILVGPLSNPAHSFNGINILSTNLDGGYEPNITPGTAYYAYTPELNLKYHINTKFDMHRQFAINGSDSAVIEISTDGGTEWKKVFASDPSTNNSYWKEHLDESISSFADRQEQFQLRIGIVESETVPWPGISIDNFSIMAEKLHTDVGITQVLSPFDDCLDCNNDTVKIWVRNYADGDAPAEIPVFFGLWGADSLLVRDTITGGISKDDSTLFTFSQLAGFPQGDIYENFVVGIDLPSDQFPGNDELTKPVIVQKNIFPDDFENFEYKGGIWLSKEGSSWQNKDMSGTITTDPESPHIWVLSPTGNYRNNDTSWVVSNCYDLSGDARNLIRFDYWSDNENGQDGARLEYTIDDGENWSILDDPDHKSVWNWTTSPVAALQSDGWTGIKEWTSARAMIPESIESNEKVKFRILFMSDGTNAQPQGFAFNNFEVIEAPADIGISSIDIPKDTCQYAYPDQINLWVKNYGYNDFKTSDNLIVGYDFESDPAVIDTFELASDLLPGDSILLTIPTIFNVESPGVYQLKAYTLSEADPWFYGSNNDTLVNSFEIWQNPITGLLDTISSRLPDTVMIEPIVEPEYTFLWGDMTTTETYDVDDPGMYYLTVTESIHGCKTNDSIYIELLFNDVGIDSILSPISSCELSGEETLQVQIRNFGTDSLIVGDKVILYYQIDGEPPVADSIILIEPLYSGAALSFSFNSEEDFSNEGDYTIKAFTDYGGDTIPQNDTSIITLSVHGYPNLDLGGDMMITGLDYLLEVAPDPRHETYLWSDGDTLPEKLIDTSGYYSLTVTDIYNCSTTDAIDIWFKIRDIKPVELVSPISSCNRSGDDQVVLKIQNSGSDTISTSDLITLSYKMNTGEVVSNNINIEILPGETYDHNFGSSVNLSEDGTYTFETTALTTGDLRVGNDTLDLEVRTNDNPEIDLGVDDDQIYTQTQMLLDAGPGDNYTYLWQDGSTSRYYTVTDITTVEVLVTDTLTGCYGGDTAFVYLDILDYMISTISLNAATCAGTYDDMEVTLLNNGNLPRQGADINLDYYVGGSLLFTESFSTTGSWPPGATRTHLTQRPLDFENTGNTQFEIIINSEGDLREDNDDYSLDMNVLPNPEIDLGPDALAVEFPYTLDAGSGHESYLWSSGSTSSTYTATTAGTYSVIVTGTNGCQTTESIYLDTELSLSPITGKSWDVDIYPNPANTYFTLDVEFDQPGIHILEVFNTHNTVFYSREITEMNYSEMFEVGDLPAGLYFIRIRSEKEFYIDKLIIQ